MTAKGKATKRQGTTNDRQAYYLATTYLLTTCFTQAQNPIPLSQNETHFAISQGTTWQVSLPTQVFHRTPNSGA